MLERLRVEQLMRRRASSAATSQRFNNLAARAAFTLIELILVLALLVIITSLALPTMSRFIRGRALGSETSRLQALMHEAQSRAVSEGMPVMLWLDAPHGTYGATLETPGQGGDAKAEDLTVDDTLKIAVLNLGTGTQTTFKNMPAIKFLPDGTIDEGSPQTIQLADSEGFTRRLTELPTRTGYEISDSQ
jgi:prepilin-type N-terminal cleavage/methylation domain-containing protein